MACGCGKKRATSPTKVKSGFEFRSKAKKKFIYTKKLKKR